MPRGVDLAIYFDWAAGGVGVFDGEAMLVVSGWLGEGGAASGGSENGFGEEIGERGAADGDGALGMAGGGFEEFRGFCALAELGDLFDPKNFQIPDKPEGGEDGKRGAVIND